MPHTSLCLDWNPLSFPCGAPSAGKVSWSHWSQTLLPPNPFRPHQANNTTGYLGELGREMKYFLLHPASLFFLSSVHPKERSTLAGLVLVCVYGWTLPLIVNGAIRPFPSTVSIGVWQRIWQTLYLHSGNSYTKGRAFTAFSFTIVSIFTLEGQLCECVCPPSCKGFSYLCVAHLSAPGKGLCWGVWGTLLSLKLVGKGVLECLFSLAQTQEGCKYARSKNSFMYSR